jgi:hypothetical protein
MGTAHDNIGFFVLSAPLALQDVHGMEIGWSPVQKMLGEEMLDEMAAL